MTPLLTPEGYAQTKIKFANMQKRLAELEARSDKPPYFPEVRQSYLSMMRQYLRDIKLYEASLARQATEPSSDSSQGPPSEHHPDV